ncbi:prepilin-type N-terminal cleavage/methylation domain-containing protein [Candidatus Albibeggiatoa sp. nov. NOAA]|uniref:prepilin-type N-terminal cleavage/methylation domain-containing protein n=1 Tax=Candidatus Albibeggiatoa sp. nov. NOAA TaxID=3162724 RepID=UPI0032F7F7D4|nr:prepilin-type N-terminal cleavage/methylation domain-containing protein [Thiotrichaceae bacterium]
MNKKSGFTLLEVLVVLVLVSLISMLLMQGLGFVLQLRTQFVNQIDDLQQGALQEYWFRSSVRSLFPAGKETNHVFTGDKQSLSGLTMASIHEEAGTPTPFKWALLPQKDKTILYYYPDLIKQPKQKWPIMEWFGKEGQFQYLSADGRWSETWPPTKFEQATQLPEAILFTAKRRQHKLQWLVSIIGVKEAPIPINQRFEF